MNSLGHLQRQGDIAVRQPPVIALSRAVTEWLAAAIDAVEVDASYRALVTPGAGRTFVAGGDI